MEWPPRGPYDDQDFESDRENYEFFNDPVERSELFQYTKKIAEYLRTEKIPNLVIIDRSSRPLYVGLREYFKSKYPDEPMPNIYFMNPKGFKARGTLTIQELSNIILDGMFKDDVYEVPHRLKSEEEILADLEDTYKKLMLDKDKPVMVFDTCIHSGKSLQPVREYLDKAGFSDIRIGSINPAEANARVQTDFYVTEDEAEKGCYPFDREKIIEKTFDSVYSRATTDPEKISRSMRLRKEIKRIVTDFLKEKDSSQSV
jgi:hypothetical protein